MIPAKNYENIINFLKLWIECCRLFSGHGVVELVKLQLISAFEMVVRHECQSWYSLLKTLQCLFVILSQPHAVMLFRFITNLRLYRIRRADWRAAFPKKDWRLWC